MEEDIIMKKVLSLVLVITMIAAMISGLTITAQASGAANYAWIESDQATIDTGVGFGSVSGDAGTTYDTLSGNKAIRTTSGTTAGVGITFNFSVEKAQSYDIFVHGTYEDNSAWMSQVTMHVDGTQKEITEDIPECWVIKGSGNPNFQIGWQKITTDLSSGSHTFRWQLDGIGTSASAHKALCDFVMVVPTNAGFEPVTYDSHDDVFSVENVMNYELCTLLTEYDLTNVEEDLAMPETTAGGYDVAWTTSNDGVIDIDGTITQTEETQTATLTATITVDGVDYEKDFEVTVGVASTEPEEPEEPEIPVEPEGPSVVDYAWIEGENGTADAGVGFGTISGAEGSTYDSVSNHKAIRVNSGTSTNIGINFAFSVETAQSYDIFVHGTYEEAPAWASQVSMHVDGTEKEVTNLGSEGWIIKGSKYNFPVGWQKVTTDLTSGNHTFRWQIDGLGSSASGNLALCDVVIVVPTSAGFVPTPLETVDSLFPVDNKMEYELCTLLTEYNLNGVEEDLTLPGLTAGGYAVTWETSDDSVIEADGTLATTEEETATLTATITVNDIDYSKDFVVTIGTPREVIPVPTEVNYAWIEADQAAIDSGVGFGSISGVAGSTYDSVSGLKAIRLNGGNRTGIGINFNFSVDTAQSYDIFVHGTYEEEPAWMSQISMHVDGTESTVTNLGGEGWIIQGSSGYNYQVGWQKVTKNLTAGDHTFRWQVDGLGSSASGNKALCDVVIVVPTGVGFIPTALETVDSVFPVANAIDYELCTLLSAYDLSAITDNVALLSKTPSNYTVTWSTSDDSVIDNKGYVTRNENVDKTVTLTASTTVDGETYSKEFTVTVAKDGLYTVNNFGITQKNGEAVVALSEGLEIKASADITSEVDGTLVIILAHYRDDDSLVKFMYEEKPIDELIVEYTVEDYEAGDYVKAFIWSDFETLVPITASISK